MNWSSATLCVVVLGAAVALIGCTKTSDQLRQSGIAKSEQHQDAEAFQELSEAIKLDSNDARAYFERALVSSRLGPSTSTESDLNRYITLTAPQLAKAYIGRGLLHRVHGGFEASVGDLDKAILLDPGNIQGFVFKEQVLREIGDTVRLQAFLHALDYSTRDRMNTESHSIGAAPAR
jgi:serine/threonine-protein kinase